MVEQVQVIPESARFTVPDPNNLSRTRNIAWPYRRKTRASIVSNFPKALAPAESELSAEKVVESGWARPDSSFRCIEQVGKGYEALKKRYAQMAERMAQGGFANFSSEDEDAEEDKGADSPEEDAKRKEEFESKRKRKTKAQIEKEALEGNLYGALEIFDETFEATEKTIHKAYRKMALKYHPDKLGDKITDRDKEVWLKIQEAYETLVDPVKKRKYDSSLPFDDKIPEEGQFDDDDFYEEFARVFVRNSKWSLKQPVPEIGDDDTPMDKVKKFYKFWNDFKSWREFSQYDEYDINEAQDRYERRYMEKENKRIRSKYVKAERARIIKLVETAYNNDPRIRKEQAEIEAEKQRKKEEIYQRKLEAKRAQEEARRKIQEKKEAEEKAKQEQIQAAKDAEKASALALKQSIRQLAEACVATFPGTNYDKFWVEARQRDLFQTVEKLDQCRAKVEEIQQKNSTNLQAKVQALEQYITQVSDNDANVAAQKAQEENKKEDAPIEDSNWTKEDIALLTKNIVRFPPGTNQRWKVITQECGRKNQKEVIKKAQELATRRQKELEENRAAQERQAEERKAKAAAQTQQRQAASAKGQQRPTKGKKGPQQQQRAAQQNGQPQAEQAQKEQVDAEGWTNTQQSQMEAAMKEFPASMATKERWIAIAEKVDDKTAKECFTRFKSIVAKLKAEQQAAAK